MTPMTSAPARQPFNDQFNQASGWMPLFWISLTFLVGIILASLFQIPVLAWWAVAGFFFLLFILLVIASRFRPDLVPRPLLLYLGFLVILSLGAARFQGTLPRLDASYIAWYNDRTYEVLVTGTVVEPPDRRDLYTNLRISATGIDTGDEILPVKGLLLARVPPGGDWHYGDVVRLRGLMETPPEGEDFSYRDYLAHQGIRAYMPSASPTRLPFTGGSPFLRLVYTIREKAIERVYKLFPEPEASLLAGILLGEDNGLPASLRQAYQDTGTAHIIAISGFNIAIIAGLFIFLFNRLLGARRGSLAAFLAILVYAVLVGATPSVMRAAFMGGLGILAAYYGRRQNGLNSLSFTAAVLALLDPHILWDAGFQLSFAATLGLVLYARPLQDWVTSLLARHISIATAEKISTPLSEFMFFTLAAQLTTLPLMAYHFGRISLISLVVNPFILPVQPAVMVISGLALLLSFISLPVGQAVAWAAWPFASYTNRVVAFFGSLPLGVVKLGKFPLVYVLLFYLFLFALTFKWIRLKAAFRPVMTPLVLISTLGVSVFLVWSSAFHAPDGRLHLTFLEVGSADGILVQAPSGQTILVNGGLSASTLSGALGERLPVFDRSLDWLVVASTQENQVGALPALLERFPVGNVLWSGNVDASRPAGDLDRWFSQNSTPVTHLYTGASLDLGSGVLMRALAVTPRGAVLLVEWGGFKALLPVGMNFDAMQDLEQGALIGNVTALLLADAGYAPLNTPAWLENLRPQVVILDVAAGDPDGLPDQAVLDSLAGTTILRTDRNGWIDLSTDGKNLVVEVEKE
jgi:competence protein ComEC